MAKKPGKKAAPEKVPGTEPITAALRQALLCCGQSLYAVGQQTGITYSRLHRFARGGQTTGRTLDALAEYLALEISAREPETAR